MNPLTPQPGSKLRQVIIPIFLVLAAFWFVGSSIWNGNELSAQSAETTPTPALASTPAIATPLPGVPVEVGGQVLFYVRERLGSLTASERAVLIEQRINRLANDPFGTPVDLKAVESPDGIDIMNGNEIILTVTQRDIDAAGIQDDLGVVAGALGQRIMDEVERTRAQNTPRARLSRAVQALLFLIIFIVILVLVNRIYKRLVKRIDAIQTETDHGHVWESSRYYRTGEWKRLAKFVLNIIRIVVFILILIFVVPLELRLFPATAKLAREILQLVLSPIIAFWDWLVAYQSNFFTIVVIIIFTYILVRLVRAFFSEIADGSIRIGGFDPDWAPFTSRMIAFLIVIASIIMAFPYIPGSDSEAFKGISVFLGLLFTLSSTAAVTNIVAGIIQTYTGAYRVGDVVKIGDVTGIVIEKRLLTTRVRTPKNEEVSIPNGNVLNNSVLNYSTLAKDNGLVLYTTITIGYDVPWQQVQNLMIAAALATPDVLPEPRPFVLQTSLNDYNVAYQINCYTKSAERMPRIYSALHENIQDKFNEAGVEIMSPAFSALRDGNTVTIPQNYLPEDYEAPVFRVADIPGKLNAGALPD